MAEYIFEKVKDNDEKEEYVMRQELIRCKDCVSFETGKDYTPYCNNYDSPFTDAEPEDFCSHAERK